MRDFYEVFFDEAVEAAPIMGVTLTSRPMREGRQPMCGVPHHAWQGYVGKLLRAGRKVVICDQVEDPPHEIRTPGYPPRSEEGGAPPFRWDPGKPAGHKP